MPEVAPQWAAGGAAAGAQLIRNGVDVTPMPPTSGELFDQLVVWVDALMGSVRVFMHDGPDQLDKALQAMQTASDQVNQTLERLVATKYTEAT